MSWKDKAAEYLADLVVNPNKSMVEQAFEAAKYFNLDQVIWLLKYLIYVLKQYLH